MSELTKQQMTALVDVAKKNPEWALQQAFRFGIASLNDGPTIDAISRAAELLDFDAKVLRECHAPDRNWSGESEAKADYDERKKIAKALRGLAG